MRESCIPEATESQSTGLSSDSTQAIGYKPARAFLKVHEPRRRFLSWHPVPKDAP